MDPKASVLPTTPRRPTRKHRGGTSAVLHPSVLVGAGSSC